MEKTHTYQDVLSQIPEWFATHFLSADALVQLVIIMGAFALSVMIYHLVRGRIAAAIDKAEMPIRIKRTILYLYTLILPPTALVIIFVITMLTRDETAAAQLVLSDSAMKLLLAWIIIHIALQFVDNLFVRNILTV